MKCSVGVEIGAKLIRVGLVDKNSRLIEWAKMKSNKERPLREIVADAAGLIKTLLAKNDIELKNVIYIGVGCPGIPDEEGEMIIKSHIMGFYNAPIQEEFKAHFNVPIYLENAGNCAALAESMIGAAEDLDFSMTINIGDGISGGIIINSRIYGGFNNAGAMIGHMVIDNHGKLCTCGRKGCFESLCSTSALIEDTAEKAQKNPASQIWQLCEQDLTQITETTAYEAMKLGDEDGKAVFDNYVENLSAALANFANIIMPEAMIICGDITILGENLLKPVREKMNASIFSRETTLPSLNLAELGSASVIIGAGMLRAIKK